jgi:hypothetical protein
MCSDTICDPACGAATSRSSGEGEKFVSPTNAYPRRSRPWNTFEAIEAEIKPMSANREKHDALGTARLGWQAEIPLRSR